MGIIEIFGTILNVLIFSINLFCGMPLVLCLSIRTQIESNIFEEKLQTINNTTS